jgi:MFS family permease
VDGAESSNSQPDQPHDNNPYVAPHAPPTDDRHDPYAALRIVDYRYYICGNLLDSLGLQMQKVAVGWEIVARLHDDPRAAAMAVGWVGLVQVLPVIFLAIPVGHLIDRSNRKHVIMAAAALMAASSLGLAAASVVHAPLLVMYACLLASGVGRAFSQPAKAAFLPQIVSRDRFSNAVTWNTGGFHLASILGPLLAGGLIFLTQSPAIVYAVDALFVLTLLMLLTLVTGRPYQPHNEPLTLRSLTAGIGFVWNTKLILSAITLDMFAVLLGGSVALLPIFARDSDLLNVDAFGLGCLTAAPAVGALLMTFVLAHRPPLRNAGQALLWAVAGFGVATIVFGFSRNFWLSLAMLFATGAFDQISVVVRHTLVQLLTPDFMRGRVAAVNSMFIGASNELGGFESGLVAALFSPVVSVVSGGIGTLAVVATVSLVWPQIRRYRQLGSLSPDWDATATAGPAKVEESGIVPAAEESLEKT